MRSYEPKPIVERERKRDYDVPVTTTSHDDRDVGAKVVMTICLAHNANADPLLHHVSRPPGGGALSHSGI